MAQPTHGISEKQISQSLLDLIESGKPTDYATIVYFNSTNPTTATIFDNVNPPVTNDPLLEDNVANLYIGTDNSTWVYNGTNYSTKVVPASSNFYINGTNTDAGNNKTSAISRTGSIIVEAESYDFGVYARGTVAGVYGFCYPGADAGVRGDGGDNAGVWGSSDTHFGVVGNSDSGIGVQGYSNAAVAGEFGIGALNTGKIATFKKGNTEVASIDGEGNIELKSLTFKNSAGTITMVIPELPTDFYAENTVIGRFSGENIEPFQFDSGVYGLITGGHANTLLGQRAGELLDVGNENTIMGHFAGRNLTNPDRLDPNFTSSLNTLIGSFAGVNLTTGYANFFGSQKSGANVTTAGHNVIIGKSAAGSGSNLGAIHDGNVIIGSGAAKYSTYSRYNVLLGAGAGGYASCEYAILLGTDAGSNNDLSHVFIAGGEISQIEKVFFGKGEKSPNPIEYLIGGTNGDGTDIHGGNIIIAGGQSTGNAKGGDLIFKVSIKDNNPTSGVSRQSLEEVFRISADDGNIGVGTNAPEEKIHIASGNLKVDNNIKVGNILPVFNNGSSLGSVQNYFGNVFSQNANINNIGANIIESNVLQIANYIEAVGLITSGYGFQIVNDGGVIIARNSTNNQTTGLLTFNTYNGVTLSTGDTTNPIKFNINNVEQARFIGGNMLIGSTVDDEVNKLQVNGGVKINFLNWKGMTTTEINDIVNPADGMEVYNTTLGVKCQYSLIHGGWIKYSHSAM